jgi:replicative DNA helicase
LELSDLFVALSVEDRLKVIFLLEKENLTLTSISRKMNLSLQESSRQLSRLKEEKLLKNIGGKALLSKLANEVPTSANVESYGRMIKDSQLKEN